MEVKMSEEKYLEQQNLLVNELKQTHVMYTKLHIGLLDALEEEFGNGVIEVVEKVSRDLLAEIYKSSSGGNETIEHLFRVLWKPLIKKGYKYNTQENNGTLNIHCSRCPIADLYKSMGGAKWGYHLYCSTDEHLAKVFNPKIEFNRKRTLMEGHDCCDHSYKYRI